MNLYAFPKLGNQPVSSITTALITATITPIWAAKNATARMVLGQINRVLEFAKYNGWRDGENPADERSKHFAPCNGWNGGAPVKAKAGNVRPVRSGGSSTRFFMTSCD